jgi:glycogen operon protein
MTIQPATTPNATAANATRVGEPRYVVRGGQPHPLGATVYPDGVNFSVFSEHALAMELLLFAAADAMEPQQVIPLSSEANQSFHFWHVFVEGVRPGQHYAYRVAGPERVGMRFDAEKVLIDPYALGNSMGLWDRQRSCQPGDNLATSMRSVVIDPLAYDWEGDRPLNRPMHETVIYEMHVGGFTRSTDAHVDAPGTFRGVIEKIPYLKALGVTAVELLPVMQFEDRDRREVEGRTLANYWGYSTMAYFAPHPGYCEKPDAGSHLDEFRDMVKALHRAGIEVILDVVFNHTDEGNHQGPTYSFRGFDNFNYYYLVPGNEHFYFDYTGCGNTFNCNHPIGSKMILDALRFWVEQMHVDGFRFDEGSVLSRGPDGAPMPFPPVLWQIELDDVLAKTKVIAEAWDAAGLYQVGHFPGFRWAEWNGLYRDTMRRFVRGEAGLVAEVADRLSGSASLYRNGRRQPVNSVNFITAHDGFTMNDLVSYNQKHNLDNGEENRDGVDENLSWNCGVEGFSDDLAVEALRERQIRNFATLLMLSQGVPMFVMGDEVRRTQRGNNNAWCQDNDLGWFDWSLTDRHGDMLSFWQRLIAFRAEHPSVHQARFFSGARNRRGLLDVSWHGTELEGPGWHDAEARALAWTLAAFDDREDLHVMANMYWEPLSFALPEIDGHVWHCAIDTALAGAAGIAPRGAEPVVPGARLEVAGRSVVVLISKPSKGSEEAA